MANAHETKERETAGGERLVPHSAFTNADEALRDAQDRAEVERVKAHEETGYVAAPGVGDYHATRRAAKLSGALLAGARGDETDDPVAEVEEAAVKAANSGHQAAADARRGAGESRQAAPRGRRPAAPAQTAGGSGSGDKPKS